MLMFVRSDGKRGQPGSRLTIQYNKSVLDNSIDTLLSNRPVSHFFSLSLSLGWQISITSTERAKRLGRENRSVAKKNLVSQSSQHVQLKDKGKLFCERIKFSHSLCAYVEAIVCVCVLLIYWSNKTPSQREQSYTNTQ